MGEKEDFEQYLSKAQSEQRRLRDLARNNPEGWKKDYVEARQSYRTSMMAACDLGERLARDADPAIGEELTALVKNYFQTLYVHQSKWPVLILNQDRSEEYRQSVAVVEAKHEELVRFLRQRI